MFANKDWGFGAWANCCGPGVFGIGTPFGPRKRMVRKGELKFLLLRVLAEEPTHGYELIRRLEDESGGLYSPSPGSVYPTLQMLEDQGYVVSEQADGKRVYRITDAGRGYLDDHEGRAKDVLRRFVKVGERFTGSEMRDVTRSFIHLAQVSFERAVGGEGDEQTLGAVKDILDRAAREIEKVWPDGASAKPAEG